MFDFAEKFIWLGISSATVMASKHLHKEGYLRAWRDSILDFFSYRATNNTELSPFSKLLVRKLIKDQSRKGVHRGEFGRSTPRKQLDDANSGNEDTNIKPRMFYTLTSMQALIKTKSNLRALNLASKGLENLYIDDRITAHVAFSSVDSAPGDGQDKIRPRSISYRHTMAGILALTDFKGWNHPLAKPILADMLNNTDKWQRKNGGWIGWGKFGKKTEGCDLWASVYAASLLNSALDSADNARLPRPMTSKAQKALNRTVNYIFQEWDHNHWLTPNLVPLENTFYLLALIGPVLHKISPKKLERVLKYIYRYWLNKTQSDFDKTVWSDQTSKYLKAPSLIIPDSRAVPLRAKIAFALYRVGEKPAHWIPFFEKAKKDFSKGVFSAPDLAFMLELELLDQS